MLMAELHYALSFTRQGRPARDCLRILLNAVNHRVEIDSEARRVSAGGRQIHLTPKEFDLLHYLVAHAGQPISHRKLLQAVWGPDYGDQVDYLRVFIKNLRKKIESNPERPEHITTEPWVGYRFNGQIEPL